MSGEPEAESRSAKPLSLQQQCYSHFLAISDALQRDCEKLLTTFREMKSLRFIDFAKVWKSMSFSCVFSLEKFVTELKQFTQKVFIIAKKYLIFGDDIYIKVGALYLLYGLYHEQPFVGLVKIRLTCDDYTNVMATLAGLKEHDCIDAAFIFAQMKLDGCFQYVAFDKRHVPEFSHFWNKPDEIVNEIFVNDPISKFTKECSEVLDNKEGLFGQLKTIDEEYKKALQSYSEKNPSSTLTSFDTNNIKELEDLSAKILNVQPAPQLENDDDDVPIKARLKQTSFKRKVPKYRQ